MKFKNYINYLKKAAGIGTLLVAEAITGTYNSGENINSKIREDANEKYSPTTYFAGGTSTDDPLKNLSVNYFSNFPTPTAFDIAKTKYEKYKSELEEKLREESMPKEFYLTPDSLNIAIKEAYNNVKKWPKEFDKRLFRLMLKQESKYNPYAVSKSGYRGLGQLGPEVIKTLRPEEYEKMIDPATGKLDTLSVNNYLFDPVKNLELTLENLEFISRFCAKKDPNWKESDLDTKRKKILFCYNAGVGKAEKHDFNHRDEREINGKRLKEENRKYPEVIMDAYHNPNIEVKL